MEVEDLEAHNQEMHAGDMPEEEGMDEEAQ